MLIKVKFSLSIFLQLASLFFLLGAWRIGGKSVLGGTIVPQDRAPFPSSSEPHNSAL